MIELRNAGAGDHGLNCIAPKLCIDKPQWSPEKSPHSPFRLCYLLLLQDIAYPGLTQTMVPRVTMNNILAAKI